MAPPAAGKFPLHFGSIFDNLCKTLLRMRGSFLGFMAGISWLVGLPSHAQDTLQVVAEPGDGIFSLLRKHGADPARHIEDFIALNEPRLGEGASLYEGTTYLIPIPSPEEEAAEVPTFARYDIFGEQYAEVPPESSRLEGAVFYLVSGHGGPDPGAMTKYNGKLISEDEYAYDVTLRLARKLLAHGATVHIIIRDPDDGIRDARVLEMDTDEVALPDQAIPLNQLARLKQRVEAVNNLYLENRGKHQRLIVTHVDSRSKGQNIDVFFYHHNKSRSGKKLAEHIHKTFQEKYAYYQPGRTYTGTFEDRSTLYLVKNTLPATAFIEIGNIRNTRDQRRILDPDNRQALANWICEGILADYEDR